ncbi:CGNR zinc finger domain-containing protein [Saccharopolyspora sp. TS4A08]|uniref:CGNR zinc finger domain-containing protein n=1 Tax=Saccharopolyspora ipomoeae TaxID=3042027 RepID=A0ABT6PG26_9PSEU|nr:CGNR zinc finger domain-containing protein [Saccharopolyspora sp. TS4A08]MDI2026975.1 CGNR zinc finger domain-containing protein [Saccharopolyspora sp. TS4A08]
MLAVPVLDLGELVEFVNEFADEPRAAAGEQAAPYPDVVSVLGWSASGDPVASANALFRVFAAERPLAELNGLLRALRPVPVMTGQGLTWAVESSGDVLPAALSTCLLGWLLHHDESRLGTCQAARCVDVYADASPTGRRRFCSPTCLNRHKVAAHRARAR